MKIRKRMLAGIVALTMAVTTLAGWTSQDSASAQSSSNAAVDTAAVNYDLSASDITMTADLSYVVSDSEVNTVTLTLEGGTFKEGIGTDDIRLDNAFEQMTVGDVSASGNTLTLKLKGTPVKNKQVNIYEAGTIVVLASGISDAQDYVTAKVPVQTPFIGFDAKTVKVSDGKVTADLIVYQKGVAALTKNDITVEGVSVTAAEVKDDHTVALTMQADAKSANEFAALVNGKKLTVGGKESTAALSEVYFMGYLDYAEQNGDNLDLTVDLCSFNGDFAANASADMVSFGGDFKDAKVKSVKVNDGDAVLALSVPANGMTPENFEFNGDVTFAPDAFENAWGEKPTAAVTDKNFYNGTAMERAYQPKGELDADTLLDIQKYTRGLDTTFGAVCYYGQIGIQVLQGAKAILEACGVLESEHAAVMKQLNKIIGMIENMQKTLDAHTLELKKIEEHLSKQDLKEYDIVYRNLNNALKGLQGTLRDAKKAYALTYWVKGDVLPTGYAITDASGKELASDAEIPDDYKISTPDGLKNPSDVFGKILDLDTATDAQVGEYNQAILDYIADQASKNNPVFTQFNNNVAGFELALSNALDLVNNVGSSYQPFDAFDTYCAQHYNFDSQSYGPRVAIRENAAVTFTQSMAVLGVLKNIAKTPEQSNYIGMNKKYHAAMEKIDSSVPAGHGTSEILAYPHGGTETEVSTGKYIKDVKLAGEETSAAAKNDLIMEGYTVVDYDLNSGIYGGKKIYLGYTTTDNYSEAIKDFRVIETSAKPSSMLIDDKWYYLCPYMGHSDFTSGKGDLNASAGGADLVIYYTKTETTDKRAVERVSFGGARDRGTSATMQRVYDTDGTTQRELNAGAGGDDIWMHQYKTRNSAGEQEYISELNLASCWGNGGDDAKNELKNAGYTVLDYDLNNRAGGAYIYLGYKTTTDKSQAITKMYLSGTKNDQAIVVDGVEYAALNNMVNLNSGKNASKIYLYYSKRTTDEPLTSLWFNNYKTGSLQEWDLNAGAGGDDIYLHYGNAFDTTKTEVVPDENDPEYYPYCYTIGKKVYLLDSKTYDIYGLKGDNRHYNFSDTTRDEFISRMQNSSIRDELYDAGLLREEDLFNDLKNLPLSTSMSRSLTFYDPFNGKLEPGRQKVNISAIESAGKSIVNYNPSFDVRINMDYTLYNETRYQEFLMLATVDTDYSATLPVEADYAKELASKFENNKLTYMMDIGGSYTTSPASKVVFYNANGSIAGYVSVADITPSTNPKNGDTYYELSLSNVANAAAAEALTARFYYNEQDYIDLTPFKEATFTVTWKNEDGTVLETDERVPYGTTPYYNGAEPKKAADNDYVYVFKGWSPEVKGITADTAYTAQYDAFPRNNTVTVVAKDVNGNDVPANLTGGGAYEYGALATLTAPQIVGYNFVGWYDEKGERLFTSSNNYELTVTESVDLIAKYKAIAKVRVQINGGRKYMIGDEEFSNTYYNTHLLGERITIRSLEDDFAFWQNDYGMVVSRSKEYTFTVTGQDKILAVTNTVMNTKVSIVWESAYDQIIKSIQLKPDQTTDEPELPTYNGNKALGWDYNCDGVYDSKDTLERAKEIAAENDGKVIIVKPIYQLNNNTYMITVNGGTITKGTPNDDGTFTQNTVISVTANEPIAGQKFSHWRDGAYKVVSYNKSYSFYADRNLTLYAVYVDASETVDAVGTTEIINMYKDTENKKLIFVSYSTVPEGCKIDKAGAIATSDEKVAANPDTFSVDSATYVLGDATESKSYRYTLTKGKVNKGDTWYVRAYLVYTDKDGNTHEILGDIVSQTM